MKEKCAKCHENSVYYRQLDGVCFHWAVALGFLPPADYTQVKRGCSRVQKGRISKVIIDKTKIPLSKFKEKLVYINPVRSFYVLERDGYYEIGYYILNLMNTYVDERYILMRIKTSANFKLKLKGTHFTKRKKELPVYELAYNKKTYLGNIEELSHILFDKGIVLKRSPGFLGDLFVTLLYETECIPRVMHSSINYLIKNIVFRKFEAKAKNSRITYYFTNFYNSNGNSIYLLIAEVPSLLSNTKYYVYKIKRTYLRSLKTMKKELKLPIIEKATCSANDLENVIMGMLRDCFSDGLKLTSPSLIQDPSKKQIALIKKHRIINFRYLHTLLFTERELKRFVKKEIFNHSDVIFLDKANFNKYYPVR